MRVERRGAGMAGKPGNMAADLTGFTPQSQGREIPGVVGDGFESSGNLRLFRRVAGGPEGGGLGEGAHRELVHVGLAEDDQPGLFEARDDRRVVGRDPALQDAGAAGGQRDARRRFAVRYVVSPITKMRQTPF